ncbi:MAG: TraB/GumN family protein [Treponema sp.]
MSGTQKVLNLNGRTFTLVGTTHISEQSVQEVVEAIRNGKPDCVAVELDEKRFAAIKNSESWRELNIVNVIKRNEGFLLLANLILASFQKRMGKNVGIKPGEEMLAAIKTAEELRIPVAMADRPIQTTLRRAWAKTSLWGKSKLLAALFASAFSKEEVSSEQIEELKNRSEMDSMLAELSTQMPTVKEVLIDERDKYLASKIWSAESASVTAIIGAGHLAGVQAHLEQLAAGSESADVSAIASVPPKSPFFKIAAWLIPAAIMLLIAAGFYFGGKNYGAALALRWILWNGIPAALGSALAGGHVVTILAAFAGAPLTSLTPVIGVGFITGLVQALICKPKVKDMENLTDDAGSVKGFYKNRILRVLLVFILSSIGSSAGTFIAGADIITKLGALIGR